MVRRGAIWGRFTAVILLGCRALRWIADTTEAALVPAVGEEDPSSVVVVIDQAALDEARQVIIDAEFGEIVRKYRRNLW